MGFVNDVNILTQSSSTEQNYTTLKRIYTAYESWAKRHRYLFLKKKFHLIYFTRTPKKVNLNVLLDIGDYIINPESDIRILGV
jgi:hypothetical protein